MAMYTILPVYYLQLGLSPIQVGLLLSANRWIRLFTNHAAERMLSQGSERVLFGGALVASSLIALYYASSPPFVLFLAARVLWGFCWSILRHAGTMKAVNESDPQMVGRNLGLFNGVIRVGFLLGTSLSGILFDQVAFGGTFLLMALFTLTGVPFAFTTFGRGKTRARTRGDDTHGGVHLELQGFILGAVGSGIIMSTLGKVLSSAAGPSGFAVGSIVVGVATLNGVLLGIRHTFGIAGSPLLGVVVDKLGIPRSVLMFTSIAAVALALGGLGLPPAALVVLVILFFLCETSLHIALAARAGASGAKRYARFVSALDLGSASGPLVGWGIIQLALSTGMVFWVGAALYLVGAVVPLLQKTKRRESEL